MRSSAIVLLGFLEVASLFSRGESCNNVSFRDTAMPIYAPISRAAHIEGSVRFSVTLTADLVPEIKPLEGSKFLEGAAQLYLEGRQYSWKYEGEHSQCAYTADIEYRILKTESDNINNFYRVTVMGLRHTLIEAQPVKPTCSDCVSDTCTSDNMLSTDKPVYPAMARAARISGDISTTLIFNKIGEVTGFEGWDGPAVLQKSAEDYLKTWKRKPLPSYMNSCRTTVMMEYRLTAATEAIESDVHVYHADPTHLLIEDHPVLIVDPAAKTTKTKSKRFWLF